MKPVTWGVVPYVGAVPFKRVRVRDEAQIQRVITQLLRRNYVAVLGAPFSEKTRLLHDVAEAGNSLGLFRPVHINLWQARSDGEAAFFSSLARLIARAPGINPPPVSEPIDAPRAFLSYIGELLQQQDRDSVLFIDHLQALPHDLVHSLLLALRSAFMEREPLSPIQLGAVVAGSVNLAGLATGPTSPFNIAHRLLLAPLDHDQSRVLAEATLGAYGARASEGALKRILEWAQGDRWLIPLLCAWSAEAVRGYRVRVVKSSVIDRAAERIWVSDQAQAPIREAVQLIEEDPDTLLDVLDLLDRGELERNRARQSISRMGVDRLQLTGAFELRDERYRIKNQVFEQALKHHFSPAGVSRVLRMNGRWREAIDYLAPRLEGGTSATARADLLEATVQSIYATDQLQDACRALVEGIERGFGLSDVHVYRVDAAHGRLCLVCPTPPDSSLRTEIGLDEQDRAEVQAFRNGDYALRLGTDAGRLVAALVPERRPIGVVTIERYIPDVEAYAADTGARELPPNFAELRRFLRHAATAIDSVMLRSAYREIGRAVLDARAVHPMFERVLTAIINALGCDYAVLYLFDAAGARLEAAVGVGKVWRPEWQEVLRFSKDGGHPVVTCLQAGESLIVPGADPQLAMPTAEHQALLHYLRVFCPLAAVGASLGTLEVGYGGQARGAFSAEDKRTLAVLADQMAIAVYNAQSLQRTDASLARQVDEMEKLREISLAVSSTLELDVVLSRIIRSLRDLFPGTEVTVWRYHSDARGFKILQSSIEDYEYLQQELDLSSVTGRALEQRRAELVPDTSALPISALRDHALRLGLCSLLTLPLISHNLALGAIDIYATARDCASLQDQPALSAFATQAAIAIDNAQRYQELEKAQRDLQAMREQELLDLAYALFHRIKNLIGVAPLQIQLLRERYSRGDPLDEPLVQIEQRIKSVIGLADSLKTLLDLPQLSDKPVDLCELLVDAADRVRTSSAVEVHVNVPVSPVWVLGDRVFLADAIQSLVDNACEAMEGRGNLTLDLSQREDGWAEMRVIDDGPGIASKDRPSIFKPGFTTKKDDQGDRRGMGLFSCAAIVRRHRGEVWLDPAPQIGATYVIKLPVHQPLIPWRTG